MIWKLPLRFEANRGQADGSVRFLAKGSGYDLSLTATEAVLNLRAAARGQKGDGPSPSPHSTSSSTALRMKLLQPVAGEYDHKYLAIYDIDADNPDDAVAALTQSASTTMFISEALDLETIKCAVFETCSPEITAKEKTPA